MNRKAHVVETWGPFYIKLNDGTGWWFIYGRDDPVQIDNPQKHALVWAAWFLAGVIGLLGLFWFVWQ